MLANPFIEILFILVLILINGYFSMAEIALVSSRKVRLEQLASDGDAGAARALQLISSTSRLLSAVQIGITLVAVLTGVFGGATLAERLTVLLSKIAWLAPYAATVSLVIVVLVTTYFSLVIGELIPKKIALNNPEKIASKVSGVMRFVSWLTAPLIHLLSISTDLGLRILGIHPSKDPPITEEEIRVLIDQGTRVGVFGEAEQDMVESVFEFSDSHIVDLMVPRPDIIALDIEDPIETNIEIMKNSNHTRYPIYKGTLDSIIGIVSIRDLWAYAQSDQPADITKVKQDILVVPDQLTALDLIRQFKNATSPLAIIIDEYGSVIGLITLHDLLEALVGDMSRVDNEEEHPLVIKRHDGSWLVDGRTSPEELCEFTGIDCTEESTKREFRTIAGFILYEMGSIPKEGDSVTWHEYEFEIVDMDGNRIDKVLITHTHPPQDEDTHL